MNGFDAMVSSRRGFLGLAGGSAALLALGSAPAQAARVKTAARIVILGAGAAGTALANRLVDRLEGAEITLLDARKQHLYQPGFTLIAAGLKPAGYSVSATKDWLPQGVTLIEEAAAEIDPVAKAVTSTGGTVLDYDFLVVATGLKLDYDSIPGMSLDLIGKDGIGSVYAGPDHAAKTWEAMDKFTTEGGVGVFSRPATEMKCAGAPLKYTFITDDYAVRKGTRDKVEIKYFANNKAFFSVPIVSEKVRMLFGERKIQTAMEHVLIALDPGRRIATFQTPEGTKEEGYDFINVIPPMRAPDVVRASGLSWADKWTD
jgi:sulfide:quinone oxidoreductase